MSDRTAAAATGAPPTAADYARAASFLPGNIDKKILNAAVQPLWLLNGRGFWYRRAGRAGTEFVAVDVESGRKAPAFDHGRLATQLEAATGCACNAWHLPFDSLVFRDKDRAIGFQISGTTWICKLDTLEVTPSPNAAIEAHGILSPDERWWAFARGYDLWLRETTTGAERRLTFDGAEHHGYGGPSGSSLTAVTDRLTGRAVALAALWSPDASKLLTYRLDERSVRELHLQQAVPTDGSASPAWHGYRMPLVGDEFVPLGHLLVVDVTSGRLQPLELPPVKRFTRCPFASRQAWWSADGERVYALSSERGHRAVAVRVADATTGAGRRLFEERGTSFVYPHHVPAVNSNVREFDLGTERSQRLTWFSQRDGWGHLETLNADTGERDLQLTHGEWTVHDILSIDTRGGWIYFTAGGREPGRDPYFRHLYRVSVDGSGLTLLTPDDADHKVTFSPDGRYFLDTLSRVDLPPVTVLHRADGTLVARLEEADISALLETGWKPPQRITVKARDGMTDLHGCVFRPTHYDPSKRYPVIDSIYPGPQRIRVPKSFASGDDGRDFWQDQALAELGFVVVNIDGLGTPFRSKAFVDVAAGRRFGEAGGLTDHVAAIRQLTRRDDSLDPDRVGIYGHSGGGFAAARAMLLFPEVFKVGVASAGNHDQRGYDAAWGEFYVGLPDGDNFATHDNTALAARLEGRLLLVHGELDDNVHPGLTLRLADALIAANRDFDLLVVPFANHAYLDLRTGSAAANRFVPGCHPYVIRRRWDYFVTHLAGATPPARFEIRWGADGA